MSQFKSKEWFSKVEVERSRVESFKVDSDRDRCRSDISTINLLAVPSFFLFVDVNEPDSRTELSSLDVEYSVDQLYEYIS